MILPKWARALGRRKHATSRCSARPGNFGSAFQKIISFFAVVDWQSLQTLVETRFESLLRKGGALGRQSLFGTTGKFWIGISENYLIFLQLPLK